MLVFLKVNFEKENEETLTMIQINLSEGQQLCQCR